jgi:integrase
MPKVSFFIQRDKKDRKGLVPIYMQVEHNYKKFRYYTGKKILPKYWSVSKTRFTKPSYPNTDDLAEDLIKMEKKINRIWNEFTERGEAITLDKLKEEFLKVPEKNNNNDFFSLFNSFIKQRESTHASSTIKNYNDTLNYYEDYRDYSGFSFSFKNINQVFYDNFIQYLISERELSNNTIGRVIKILKAFMTWTYDKGYHDNNYYRKFKVYKEDIDIVYLTYDELMRLYGFKMPNKHLDKARDLFCFGCFTGLRFSDFTNIRPENYSDGKLLIRTTKTDEPLKIPLIKQAEEILIKYKFSLPPISNQKLNEYLRDAAEEAKIDKPVTIQKRSGGKRTFISEPKHKFLSTHTARRTFITLSLEKGVRPETLMRITGHRSLRSFQKYIKIIDTVVADELSKAWK